MRSTSMSSCCFMNDRPFTVAWVSAADPSLASQDAHSLGQAATRVSAAASITCTRQGISLLTLAAH